MTDFANRSRTTSTPSTSSSSATSLGGGFSLDGLLGELGLGAQQPVTIAPPRVVQGKGGFVYKQDPDGTITILSGPARVGEVHPPTDDVGAAITREIGPYQPLVEGAPPQPGLLERVRDGLAAFDPLGWLTGSGSETSPEASPEPSPNAPGDATTPTRPDGAAFRDGTRSVEGSTLDVAQSRVGMETKYKLGGFAGTELADMNAGAKDASAFFCSGFSVWTLAASGYDVEETIKGSDGVPFSYTDGNAPEQPGTPVTLRALINGEGPAVAVMNKVEKDQRTNGGWVMHVDNDRIGFQDGLGGKDATAAVKGAAGAFELAGIGSEVAELEQRPGDFAQSRYTNKIQDADKELHEGAGHAWQVLTVTVQGRAEFGQPGSPVPTSGELVGWHDDVEFVIDDKTDPSRVGPVTVKSATRIEANVAGARVGSQKQDANHDGGVGISRSLAVPDEDGPKHYDNYVVFYGRLSSSKWAK